MDNLCHTLAGAALADAGVKRYAPRAMATLMIASNLPDIDVAVFATATLPMAFRRGWTHGVLAMAVLPAAFAGLMYLVDRVAKVRNKATLKGLLLLSYVATWLHVFMDYLNSYGVRLLSPFSEQWFYGDALYIIDPILYVLFGGAIVVTRLLRRKGSHSPRPAQLGFSIAAVYMLLMLVSNVWARGVVRDGLDRAGRPPDTRFMVTPVFGNPISRDVIVEVGSRYEKGFLWFEPLPHFRPAGYGVDKNAHHPLAQRAAQTRIGREYLSWSRFPFFVIDPVRRRVQLNDYRYAGPGGRETWLAAWVDLQ